MFHRHYSTLSLSRDKIYSQLLCQNRGLTALPLVVDQKAQTTAGLDSVYFSLLDLQDNEESL
jgi:hypothetical protein